MDNNEFRSEYLDALQDDHYLKLINEKLILWENMAKSELAKLKYNPDIYSDEANDILSGYLGKENEKNQRKTKKLERAKTMYQTLQHVSFVKYCIANKRLILAILYSLETPIYLLAADFSSGLKARLSGREGGTKSARRSSDYIRWAVEDADLETRRPDLTNEARAAIIAKRYPKEDGTSLSNSAILKGIKMGKSGIQG